MNDERRDFDDWFSQNYRRVLSSVLIVCAGDMHRAEDATNDAFLDALQKWDKVSAMDSPRSWVTKVAINKAKRSWLRRKRYVDPVNVDTLDLAVFDEQSTTAGLQQRQGFRRRVLAGAAGVFAVVALVGGIFAFTGDDDISTTETAADDTDTALVSGEPQDLPTQAVARDSAPVELPTTLRNETLEVLAIDGQSIVEFSTNTVPTRLQFHVGGAGEYPSDTLEVFGPCRADAYAIAWDLQEPNTFRILEEATPQLDSSSCISRLAHSHFLPGQTLTVTLLDSAQGQLMIQSRGEPAWNITATLFEPMPVAVDEVAAVVNIGECANDSTILLNGDSWLGWNVPAEWAGRETVPVTVTIAESFLIATDSNGLSAPFEFDWGEGGRRICDAFLTDLATGPILPIVPDLVGMSSAEAHSFLTAARIPSLRVAQKSEAVPDGVVISTSPASGAVLEPDETIFVTTSSGQRDVPPTTIPFTTPEETLPPRTAAADPVVIPAVAGLEFNEALDRLFEADLRTSRIDEASTSVPTGMVIRTDPPAGAIAEAAESRPIVTLIVSSGPPPSTSGPGPDAVLAIEADIDGEPGNEQIWLDPDGTLHAGDLVGYANYWDEVSDYWFNEQAELTTAMFDTDTLAIIVTLPTPNEDEDPPNIVQVFLVREQGLSRVFEQTLGTYGVHPLTVNGDGSVSYVEDGWAACTRTGGTGVVARQRLTLTPGEDYELIQSSSEDTDLLQDCSQLAG